jgi:hypothetical protein
VGSLASRCAHAVSGHTVAPPSVPMNFRRPMWIAMRPSEGGHEHAMEERYHALAKDEQCFCAAKILSRLSPSGVNNGCARSSAVSQLRLNEQTSTTIVGRVSA